MQQLASPCTLVVRIHTQEVPSSSLGAPTIVFNNLRSPTAPSQWLCPHRCPHRPRFIAGLRGRGLHSRTRRIVGVYVLPDNETRRAQLQKVLRRSCLWLVVWQSRRVVSGWANEAGLILSHDLIEGCGPSSNSFAHVTAGLPERQNEGGRVNLSRDSSVGRRRYTFRLAGARGKEKNEKQNRATGRRGFGISGRAVCT